MDSEAREARRRLVIAAAAVVAVLALTFGLLFVLRDQPSSSRGRSASSVPSSTVASTASGSVAGVAESPVIDPSVYVMPKTKSMLDFSRSYAIALSTWDSTTQTLADRRELLLAWTPATGWWTDAESMLDDWLGDQSTWDAARRAEMSQTVKVNRVWIPAEMKKWMGSHSKEWEAQNWATGVNVNMTWMVRGVPGASQDRPFTVTVLVSCPPGDECVALGPGRSVMED